MELVKKFLFIFPILLSGCTGVLMQKNSLEDNYNYVAIDDENCTHRHILRTPAKTLSFPLSSEDKDHVDILVNKFKNEENCAGLAAPQIGISKRIIVLHVPEDYKNFRKDIFEVVPMTVFINLSYTPLSKQKQTDWEGCFSVLKTMGEVARYQSISYEGYDLEGKKIQGIAHGFLARLIQHEVGHTKQELFIDLLENHNRRGTREEIRAIRLKEIEEKKSKI